MNNRLAVTSPDNGTGTWKTNTYHTRDCRAVHQANPDNLTPVSDDEADCYNMRECTVCQSLKTTEYLEETA